MSETKTKIFTVDEHSYEITHPFTASTFVEDFQDAELWANGLNNYRHKNVTSNLSNKITNDKASAEALGNDYVYPTQEDVTKFDLAYRPNQRAGAGRKRDPIAAGVMTMAMDAIKDQIIKAGYKCGQGGYTDTMIRAQAQQNLDTDAELAESYRTATIEFLKKQQELNTKQLIDLPEK